MKNYILMLGIAAVSIGSYAAYASNSATMTVTATIAHDVSLSVTQDIDLGTITINPAYTGTDTMWNYSDSGTIDSSKGATVSASNATAGTFTANIPNPTACNGKSSKCGGLSLPNLGLIFNVFGGSDKNTACAFFLKYSGSENIFIVSPKACTIKDVSKVTTGEYEQTFIINYTAS
ncbi:MAG: hypothetical protein IJ689_07210 [Alphaproteobacteria bacterium]|nr:hypothetical protein [Alphaproteobacteria bacterium]